MYSVTPICENERPIAIDNPTTHTPTKIVIKNAGVAVVNIAPINIVNGTTNAFARAKDRDVLIIVDKSFKRSLSPSLYQYNVSYANATIRIFPEIDLGENVDKILLADAFVRSKTDIILAVNVNTLILLILYLGAVRKFLLPAYPLNVINFFTVPFLRVISSMR